MGRIQRDPRPRGVGRPAEPPRRFTARVRPPARRRRRAPPARRTGGSRSVPVALPPPGGRRVADGHGVGACAVDRPHVRVGSRSSRSVGGGRLRGVHSRGVVGVRWCRGVATSRQSVVADVDVAQPDDATDQKHDSRSHLVSHENTKQSSKCHARHEEHVSIHVVEVDLVRLSAKLCCDSIWDAHERPAPVERPRPARSSVYVHLDKPP